MRKADCKKALDGFDLAICIAPGCGEYRERRQEAYRLLSRDSQG